MPVDQTKTPQQILELPTGLNQEQLVDLVNDRIRALNDSLKLYVQNPATANVGLGAQRITSLADPKDDLDGVNLRTLKKFAGLGEERKAVGDGIEEPTVVFTFDGAPADGQTSPSFTVNENRDGFTPVVVSFTADGAPISAPATANLTIAGVDMLTADLALPVGETGPVYSQAFALPGALPKGTKIRAVIVTAGGATQTVVELVIRGS